MIRIVTLVLAAALATGCAVNPHYWHQAGRGQSDFEHDSAGCAEGNHWLDRADGGNIDSSAKDRTGEVTDRGRLGAA